MITFLQLAFAWTATERPAAAVASAARAGACELAAAGDYPRTCGGLPGAPEPAAGEMVLESDPAAHILADELLPMVGMELPVQITYRDVEPSPAMDAAIRKQVDRLDALYPKIISCRVAVQTASQRHRTGNPFQIRIDLAVPGTELVVDRPQSKGNLHQDFFVALRDAFRAARRELKTYSQKQRGIDVKRHEEAPHALVTDIFRGEGYGFLRATDGHSIYFHANSVVGGIDNLEVGMIASYVEEQGENGPQATVVRSIGWAQTTSVTPSA